MRQSCQAACSARTALAVALDQSQDRHLRAPRAASSV